MQSAGFEWDDAKAAENLAKHGVGFETASRVFTDPFAIERLDDRRDYAASSRRVEPGPWSAARS
jgi:uncharacterized DUF497 family protein